jgi:formate dehydrogenase subunit gamma
MALERGGFIMKHTTYALRAMLIGLIGLCAMALSGPVSAQGVNPQASAAKEEQMLTQLQQVQGRITIPDQKAAVLMQPMGREWRQFHNTTMFWTGAVAILGMLGALTAFYTVRGRIMIDAGPSMQRILRFTGFERFVHWLTASSFIVLAITGLNVAFGRFLLLPLIGPEAFTAFSQWGKYAHNFLAFPFMIGVVFMFLVWVKDNLPTGLDLVWLKAAGGLFGSSHPPAKKFNAGQKIIFWIVIFGGTALSITGLSLIFPFYASGIEGMQVAQIIHGLVAGIVTAIMIAHIYIGSVGMEGAIDAMASGEVDLNWAKEHHSLWVEEEMAKGHGPKTLPHGVAAE